MIRSGQRRARAQDVSLTLDQDTSATFAQLGRDVDGDALAYQITGAPTHGADVRGRLVHVQGRRRLPRPRRADYTTTDPTGASAPANARFTFKARDASTEANPTTATITG